MSSGHIIDQDGKFTFVVDGLFTSVKMADDGWIGLGAAKGRMEFDDQSTDEINFLDCRVGIGTSSPEVRLHFVGTAGAFPSVNVATVLIVENQVASYQTFLTGRTGNAGLIFGDEDDADEGFILYDHGGGIGGVDSLNFGTNNVLSRMTIDGAGNVGIGTTTFGTNAAGTFAMANGTAPTADVANQHAYYSADFVAGNACPYFRTENGTVIGLNQSLLTTDSPTFNKVKITTLGGIAIQLTNKTGGNTIAGTVVETYTTAAVDDAFDLACADCLEHIGIVLDTGIADGSEAWIVVSGIADVAMKDNTLAARGNWVQMSDEIGYADATNAAAPQPINQTHFTEVGHCIESVAAGGGGTHILARCVIHFN